MKLQQMILGFLLRIEYFFVSKMKIKPRRITFISLEAKRLEGDFQKIEAMLDHHHYDIRLCLLFFKKNLAGQFKYFLNCFKQCYLINTSALVLLNDNNYVVSKFKRSEVKVLQVWHACGAIKKFGMDMDRKYPIKHYDYVLATSNFWKPYYSRAFAVNQDQVLNLGMPRLDDLLDIGQMQRYQNDIFLKYPQLKGKRIVLYAPTFRGNIYDGFHALPLDLEKIVNACDDVVVICKFHPQLGNLTLQTHPRIYYLNQEPLYSLFAVSDCLISDYSSIIFDYMLLNRGILLYVPDHETYAKERGYYVDPKSLTLPLCYHEEDVIDYLKNPYPINYKQLKDQFFDYQDGQNTLRVVTFINQLLHEYATSE